MKATQPNEQSMPPTPTELEMAEAVIQKLSMHGEAKLAYVSAELEPFSRQQKPDIIFKRNEDEKLLFFIDFKLSKNKPFHSEYIRSSCERKAFILETVTGYTTIYIVGTNATLTQEQRNFLESFDIPSVDEINSADDFASALMKIIERTPKTNGK